MCTPRDKFSRIAPCCVHTYVRIHTAGKDAKRSKKQYRRDQTERRQKRIERSKAKGASKDVWGLRREGECMSASPVR